MLVAPNYTGENLIFIVGCPRSGTTWLQQLLASYPKAKSGPESHIFAWHIGPQLKVWREELEWAVRAKDYPSGGPFAYLREEEFLACLKEYLLTLMKPMIGTLEPGEFFVEKTATHALFIPEIVQFLPDCKIIHILRDARDVVASMLALSKTFEANGWQKPGWPPESARSAARMWTSHVSAVRASSRKLSRNQFYELRYRDLKLSPESELLKLSEFLRWEWGRDSIIDVVRRHDPKLAKESGTATGLFTSGELGAITGLSLVKTKGFARKAKIGSWKEELSWKQKLGVWIVARKTMKEFGYQWKYPW